MRGQLQNSSRSSFSSIVVPADQRCRERYEHFYQEEKTVTIVDQRAHHRIHLVRVVVSDQIYSAYGIQRRHEVYGDDCGNQRRIFTEGGIQTPGSSEILRECCRHQCQEYPADCQSSHSLFPISTDFTTYSKVRARRSVQDDERLKSPLNRKIFSLLSDADSSN